MFEIFARGGNVNTNTLNLLQEPTTGNSNGGNTTTPVQLLKNATSAISIYLQQTRTSRCRSRNTWLTAAAFMNWGRAPTTEVIFTGYLAPTFVKI